MKEKYTMECSQKNLQKECFLNSLDSAMSIQLIVHGLEAGVKANILSFAKDCGVLEVEINDNKESLAVELKKIFGENAIRKESQKRYYIEVRDKPDILMPTYENYIGCLDDIEFELCEDPLTQKMTDRIKLEKNLVLQIKDVWSKKEFILCIEKFEKI
jgi:hypothetical protein